jgi:hypothetical protein
MQRRACCLRVHGSTVDSARVMQASTLVRSASAGGIDPGFICVTQQTQYHVGACLHLPMLMLFLTGVCTASRAAAHMSVLQCNTVLASLTRFWVGQAERMLQAF